MRTSLAFGLAILVGYNHAAPVDDSAAIAAAIAGVYDAPKTSTPATTTSKISQSTVITSAVPTATASEAGGCGIIAAASSSYLVANPDTTGVAPIPFAASVAMDCLESVPLDVDRSTAYCDFIEPYFQFQSTLAYLKDPPEGYLLPGVDLLGGLAEIRDNLQTGKYSNQWEFEVDLYTLGNVLHHDFHMNLPLPLVSVFAFVPRNGILVSVSSDGLALPDVYFKSDLNAQFDSNTTAGFTPSPIVSVNGQDISTYIQTLAQTMSSFQDPDALWNQVFFSLPANGYNANNLGLSAQGGYMYGFTNDSYTYSFANGTETEIENVAVVNINADFTTILTGQDLFDTVDLPPASETASASDEVTAAPTSSTPAATSAALSTTTSLVGYPSPVVIQPDGYTSGYFLDNTTIAVLAMQGFIDAEEANPLAPNDQQTAIKEFLAACKEAGMTKLIIDLSTNGGGDVLSGFDAFKQLFPTLQPFGASRLRATPLVNYLGAINSADGYYNDVNNSIYQIQSALDVNDHPFANWQLEDGPYLIHGDNFTAEIRSNFSDPVQDADGNYTVSGFLNNSNIAPQLFQPSDMVMVMDGGCGSTCAIFAELMKSQGGVRTITLGGRPQYGPSQGVGGSKGAQVFTYGDIIQTVASAPNTVADLEQKGIDLSLLPDPNDIPDEYLLDLEDNVPLGTNAALTAGGRINLRNNMHDGDSTFTPLQFIYEPGVCRLFYKAEDIFDFSNVWARVAEVAWGNGKCVQGSTITKNNTIPAGPYDTVPWSSDVVSSIKQDYSPGLLGYANGTGGTSTDVNSTQPTPSSPNSSPTFTAGASLLSSRSAGVFGIFGVLLAVLV